MSAIAVENKLTFGKIELSELTGRERPAGLENAWKVWHGVKKEKSETIDIYISILKGGKINYQERGQTRIGIDFPIEYTPKVNLSFNQKAELIGIADVSYSPEVDVKTLLKDVEAFVKSKQVQADLKKLNMPSLQ